jgi:hypothetical protein
VTVSLEGCAEQRKKKQHATGSEGDYGYDYDYG